MRLHPQLLEKRLNGHDGGDREPIGSHGFLSKPEDPCDRMDTEGLRARLRQYQHGSRPIIHPGGIAGRNRAVRLERRHQTT